MMLQRHISNQCHLWLSASVLWQRRHNGICWKDALRNVSWRFENYYSSKSPSGWRILIQIIPLSMTQNLFSVFQNCHTKIRDLFSEKIYLIGIAALVVAVIMVRDSECVCMCVKLHSTVIWCCLHQIWPLFNTFFLSRSLRWSSAWCSAVVSETALFTKTRARYVL